MEIDSFITDAIKRIKQEQTFISAIFNINYYYFIKIFSVLTSMFYISFVHILAKRYKIKSVTINHKNMKYKSDKTPDLVLYDNGIVLNYLFVPYENIIKFSYNNDSFDLILFAKLEDSDDNLILNLGYNVIKLNVLSEHALQIFKNIKSNLYYHIKYNKINPDIIKNYYDEYIKIKKTN